MLKFVILFAIIASVLIVMLLVDTSREATIKREQSLAKTRLKIERTIAPIRESVTRAAGADKVSDTERKYKQAGFKLSFFATRLISLVAAALLFFFCWKLLNNPYMGVVGIICGWFIPDLVIGAIANKKIEKMDEPIGSFMKMTVERYATGVSFRKALLTTIPEMRLYDDFYKELIVTTRALDQREPIVEALYDLAERCQNKYLWRYADFYRIAEKQGTQDSIEFTLMQAVKDHERHLKDVRMIKRQLNAVTMESKVMLATVVLVVIYGSVTDPYYIEFFTTTEMGKFGAAAILFFFLFSMWLVFYKLGAPIDKEDEKERNKKV